MHSGQNATMPLPEGTLETIRLRSAEMFVEVQRADTKAAALFGVTGGLLAAVLACALSDSVQRAGRPLLVPLGVLSLPLLVAVVMALAALRPTLDWQCGLPLRAERHFDSGTTPPRWIRRIQPLGQQDQILAEVRRLVMLRSLARRKYRLIRLAVDLVVTAHGMAGTTLLITALAL
ncbi:hypothetical protein ACFUIZ_15020 [Streptomyces cinereoruber]|uniref:hypothetical protein n=1 Tax=Streptomyces cinereoruber TaxID=67260 RepID=UPI0036390DFC